jgi:rhamnosyltransferase
MAKALVIAHYHSNGLVRDDTLELLQQLEASFQKIIFVSTHLLESEKSKLPKRVEVFVRENIGYDFYSYRLGILTLKEDANLWNLLEYVTVMNTSFVCFDVSKFIDQYIKGLDQRYFEVIGLIKTRLIKTHIQSFLFTLSPKALYNPRFLNWWESMLPINDRAEVIMQLEIGFSVMLAQEKIALKGMYAKPLSTQVIDALKAGPYKLLKILKIRPYKKIRNITFANFYEIYEQFGIVKIELLKKNTFNQDIGGFVEHLNSSPKEKLLYQQALDN